MKSDNVQSSLIPYVTGVALVEFENIDAIYVIIYIVSRANSANTKYSTN